MEPQTPGPEVVHRKGIAQKRAVQSLQQSSAKSNKYPWLNDRRRCMKDSRYCLFKTDKGLTEGCVHCSKDEGGHKDMRTPVPHWILTKRV